MMMAIAGLFTAYIMRKVNLNDGVKKRCFCLKDPEVLLSKTLWCTEGGRQKHFNISQEMINSLCNTSVSYLKVKAVTLLPLSILLWPVNCQFKDCLLQTA